MSALDTICRWCREGYELCVNEAGRFFHRVAKGTAKEKRVQCQGEGGT